MYRLRPLTSTSVAALSLTIIMSHDHVFEEVQKNKISHNGVLWFGLVYLHRKSCHQNCIQIRCFRHQWPWRIYTIYRVAKEFLCIRKSFPVSCQSLVRPTVHIFYSCEKNLVTWRIYIYIKLYMLYSSKYIYNVEFSFVKVCINFFLVATVYIYIYLYIHTHTHTHTVFQEE